MITLLLNRLPVSNKFAKAGSSGVIENEWPFIREKILINLIGEVRRATADTNADARQAFERLKD